MSQPGNRVYYSGEVGFLYGQSIGKDAQALHHGDVVEVADEKLQFFLE